MAGAIARYAEENRVAAILTTSDNFYSDNAELLLEPMEWVLQQKIPFLDRLGKSRRGERPPHRCRGGGIRIAAAL
ncbi:MAG TPA: hypothetical protein VMS99_17680, partial [Acidimicrobiia bacterium]|nr:hypothetical protein [Acidimicrobiia bacterium]